MHSRARIRQLADETRLRHWPADTLPIDIDLILERMGIDIIPIANLRREVGVEACISADLACVYLDLEYARDERMNPRVRFSLAHELGHVVLHAHVFQEFRDEGHKSVLEWAARIQKRVDTELLEREANEFAGCFLAPDDALLAHYYELYPEVRSRLRASGLAPEALEPETLYAYVANAICRAFDVSPKVISIRLERIRPPDRGC